MPYATNGSVKIWWEEEGEGEPVLAIMGLSFPLEMWHRVTPRLAAHYRVILFDNRGVGRSDVPDGPYSIARMATDAIAVLDAAGVDSAHVIGASMGGMIAQELALRFPARVRSLILGCTWCGGLRAIRPKLRALPFMADFRNLDPAEKMRAFIPLLYTPETPADLIEEDIRMRIRTSQTRKGYHNQLLGILPWNSWRRLPQIQHPVKILHGEADRLIPVENAHILASRIPNASVCVLPGAGHVFTTDQPELANDAAILFLQQIQNGRNA